MTAPRDVCLPVLLLLICLSGCGSREYRFERLDGDQTIAVPLKFDGLYGHRDGAVVTAEARFSDHDDAVTMNIALFLRPPAEFKSGTYRAIIGGRTSSGAVECPALDFQGGQTAQPTVGGLFVLKDENNVPIYRVRIPATQLK